MKTERVNSRILLLFYQEALGSSVSSLSSLHALNSSLQDRFSLHPFSSDQTHSRLLFCLCHSVVLLVRSVCSEGHRKPVTQTTRPNLTLAAFGTHMGMVALTKEQLAELKEIFVRFDRDGDGSLTELEIGALMRSLGLQPNAEQIAAFIQRADKNSNGLIEFPEFVALIGSDSTEEISYNQDELLALFRKFDRDGNGYITAAELAHSMAKMGHALSVRELTDMIREADTDGDGRISFAEFCAAMTNAASEYMSPHLR